MHWNEDARVKIPAILHCMRLGYDYVSLKSENCLIDKSTNIFSAVFLSSIQRINPGLSDREARQALDEVLLSLENEDLGRAFYKRLINKSGLRLIDFENFDQNTFQVVTELTYKNGDDEFRPDITLLINGMPLVFIEVKIPNNRDGILAEQKRIKTGTLKNLKPEGFMKVRLPNGEKYDGVWLNGQMQRAFSIRNRRNAEPVYHFH